MRMEHPQFTSEEGARSTGGADAEGSRSILSRCLLSVDKTLSSASSLGIVPLDDPDLEYLSQVWNGEKTGCRVCPVLFFSFRKPTDCQRRMRVVIEFVDDGKIIDTEHLRALQGNDMPYSLVKR